MLFLLNDVVFDLDEACPVTAADARRFEKLGFDYLLTRGCELFAEDPLLHQNDPETARPTSTRPCSPPPPSVATPIWSSRSSAPCPSRSCAS